MKVMVYEQERALVDGGQVDFRGHPMKGTLQDKVRRVGPLILQLGDKLTSLQVQRS